MSEDSIAIIKNIKNILENNGKILNCHDHSKEYKDLFNKLKEFNDKITIDLLEDDQSLQNFEDFYKYVAKKIADILIKSGEIDGNLFNEIKKNFIKANKRDLILFQQIKNYYEDTINKMISIHDICNSLVIVREIYFNDEDKYNNKSYNEDCDEISRVPLSITELRTLYEKINEEFKTWDESAFITYFFDWVLKYAYIIEGHIKLILKFLLKLYYMLKGKNVHYVDGYEIYDLLDKLRLDQQLRDYRNSIFHSNFNLKYNKNLNNCYVIFFKKNYKHQRITIRQFIKNFGKVLLLIRTFVFAFTFAFTDFNEYIDMFD